MFYRMIVLLSKLYTKIFLRGFANVGKNTIIKPILNSQNRDKIYIGNNVNIGIFSWISVSTEYAGYSCINKKISLRIGDNVDIGNNAFIVANHNITIGNNVIMAPYVYISDHIHSYMDIEKNLNEQPLTDGGFVEIGNNVFIGIKACIMPNIRIGEGSIIGAGAIVTKDIPSRSVVVGNPARVIKYYDKKKKKWIKV